VASTARFANDWLTPTEAAKVVGVRVDGLEHHVRKLRVRVLMLPAGQRGRRLFNRTDCEELRRWRQRFGRRRRRKDGSVSER
jgi:hypothetical protein